MSEQKEIVEVETSSHQDSQEDQLNLRANLNDTTPEDSDVIQEDTPVRFRGSKSFNVNVSQIPTEPPFKALVHYLAPESTKEEIEEFLGLDIISFDVPKKGPANVEFDSLVSLIKALQLKRKVFKTKEVKISLPFSKEKSKIPRGTRVKKETKVPADDETGEPRQVIISEVDVSTVPTEGPFKAYVSNIPYKTNIPELRQFFSQSLKYISFPRKPGKGFCFIEFEDRDSLINGLRLNGNIFKNRQIIVSIYRKSSDTREPRRTSSRDAYPTDATQTRQAKAEQTNVKNWADETSDNNEATLEPAASADTSNQAFVGNLPDGKKEKDLEEFFSGLEIVGVHENPKSRGKPFCFVEFKDPETLAKALEFNNKTYKNRVIRVALIRKQASNRNRWQGGYRDGSCSFYSTRPATDDNYKKYTKRIENWADETSSFDEEPGNALDSIETRGGRNSSNIPTEPPFRAYVGNLHYDIQESDLLQFFDGLNVNSIDSNRTNANLSFRFVEFDDQNSLIKALERNLEELKGRQIHVRLPVVKNKFRSSHLRSNRNDTDAERNTGHPRERRNRYGDKSTRGQRGYRHNAQLDAQSPQEEDVETKKDVVEPTNVKTEDLPKEDANSKGDVHDTVVKVESIPSEDSNSQGEVNDKPSQDSKTVPNESSQGDIKEETLQE